MQPDESNATTMSDSSQSGDAYGRSLRKLWLLEDECVFLNHGSFGAAPLPVIQAQRSWQRRMERRPIRFLVKELPGLIRAAAQRLGEFLGTNGERIAFVPNATAGITAVLRSMRFEPGDEIVVTDHGYGAIRKLAEFIALRTGAKVIEARVPFPIQSPDEILPAIEQVFTHRTRALIVDHVTSPTALVFPIERIVRFCREKGAAVIVDGAHAPGMVPLDLDALDADYYVGNCHKWLMSPKGAGFIRVSDAFRDELQPLIVSWGWPDAGLTQFDWPGTLDPSPWLCVADAIEFIEGLDAAKLMRRNHDVAVQGARLLAEQWGTVLPAPGSMFGTMATIELPAGISKAATKEFAEALRDELYETDRVEVQISAFADRLWARISIQAYNDLNDVETLARAIARRFRG